VTVPRTVLVTGSASSKCSRHRARNPTALESWVRGDHVAALELDVTKEASMVAAVAATLERFGTVDALVNNAGYRSTMCCQS
jgi:NAD(P)-dependent dehydrogenase (short-subunit alcohol dehydrogenase family)